MPEAEMFVEKRTNPRLSIKIPVKYRLVDNQMEMTSVQEWQKAEQNAYTLDMSLGGLQIVVDKPLKVGSIHQFDIYLLEKTDCICPYAEVIWSNEKSSGLKFLMMMSEDMEHLKDFLEKTSGG